MPEFLLITEQTVLKPGDWVRQINEEGTYEEHKLGQWEPRVKGFYVKPQGKDYSYAGVAFYLRLEHMINRKFELLVTS
jgi:hypothetical protein